MTKLAHCAIVCFATLGMGSPCIAAPAVHLFEPPPSLSVEGAPRPAEALAAAPTGAPRAPCTPQGSVSRNGSIVSVQLDYVRARFTINNPDPTDPQGGEDPVELRSYGGCKTGPVIDVNPGDTLRVDLRNKLDVNDPTCVDKPDKNLNDRGVPPASCFNTTNLHTHGLHVSPAGNSDNVLLNIGPQTEFPYEINVPSDHPAGTFWYHAHRHGSTALNVASGASGILIVKGTRPYSPPTSQNPHPTADIDTILHDTTGAPFPEELFLFQQIGYACFANHPDGPTKDWWQNIYTTAWLYNADTKSSDPAASAPWVCPLSSPGKPVSPGAVENFALQLFSSTIWDTNGRFTSINGVVQPTITLPAGQIQRWRFVHAGIHDTINVQIVRATPETKKLIENSALSGNREQQKSELTAACSATPDTLIPQFEIASDGLTRAKVRTIHAKPVGGGLQESNYLQPGYRSDILVAFPTEGDYCLLDQAAPAQQRVSSGGGGGQGPSTPQLLAYVHVKGGHAVAGDLQAYVEGSLADANPNLPTPVREGLRTGDLSPWAPFLELPPPPAKSEVQHVQFEINVKPTLAFQINGKSYDPDVVNITRQVNTTDDWVLSVGGDAQEPHIFHIHVNPFEVMDVTDDKQESIFDKDGNCKPSVLSDENGLANQYCGMYHVFRDTVFVENNYQVHIRTKYDRYIGEYVIHCHILDHEDAGMMWNISIVPDIHAPGYGLGMPSMKHAMPAMTPRP